MLPSLEADDFDGCETISHATDRLAGILAETDEALLDLSDTLGDPGIFERWLRKQCLRLPGDAAALVNGIGLRDLLERASAGKQHRSQARTRGLRALDLGYHETQGIIRIELPSGFAGRIIVECATERLDASALHDAIEDFEDRELRQLAEADDHGWARRRNGTGTRIDRRRDRI